MAFQINGDLRLQAEPHLGGDVAIQSQLTDHA